MKNTQWRNRIGGMWDIIGPLQFEFLVQQGLLPDHYLLDVGCGCLRAGVHFAKYLEEHHYCGMDKSQELLDHGVEELNALGIRGGVVRLERSSDFAFTVFNQTFDFALAQSVFTHLPLNSIYRCLFEIKKVLKPNGKYYATFFHDVDGQHISSNIKHAPGGITTYSDKDPFHYHLSHFEYMADRIGLHVDLIGDWNHPRNQQMLVFGQL